MNYQTIITIIRSNNPFLDIGLLFAYTHVAYVMIFYCMDIMKLQVIADPERYKFER